MIPNGHNDFDYKVIVLLSGGMDSTACIQFYKNQGFDVQSVFIDYGQKSAYNEKKSARAVARYYKTQINCIDSVAKIRDLSGVILGRNASLLFTAFMHLQLIKGILALGIHSGTDYPDSTTNFTKHIQSIFDLYTNGKVKMGAPFLKWSKSDIWEYLKAENAPINLTYSCELGLEQPCGNCKSCSDLETLYAST